MIASIDHFVITVADQEATLNFYENALGFTRELAPGRPAALKFGSQKINVHQIDRAFEPKAERPTPGSADFCFVADWALTGEVPLWVRRDPKQKWRPALPAPTKWLLVRGCGSRARPLVPPH